MFKFLPYYLPSYTDWIFFNFVYKNQLSKIGKIATGWLVVIRHLSKWFSESIKEMRHIEMPKADPKKSILHFQKLEMINSFSKKDKSILVQTFVYVLLFNPFIFGQTIDVSLIKL